MVARAARPRPRCGRASGSRLLLPSALVLGALPLAGACASRSVAPALAAAAGRLILVDVDADPLGLGGHPGALFEIDAETRAVKLLCSSRELDDPVDVVGERDASLLVVDLGTRRGGGRLLRVSADGRDVVPVASQVPLVAPTAIARARDGALWIVDRGARAAPLGAEPSTPAEVSGAVFRLAADLSSWELVASGPPLEAPADVCCAGDEVLVLDADALRREIADFSEGAVFRVAADGRTLELVAALRLVSPLSFAVDGAAFFVTDVNADPVERRRLRGAVYRVAAGGEVELFVQDPAWRDPACGTLFRGALLVVDSNADPLGLGADPVGRGFAGNGRGGVYSVDLATRAVTLFCASGDFVNPVRLRVLP